MYYILTEQGSQIVDSQMHRPTQAELDGMAQDFKCSLYVIEGEHYGMTATYTPPDEDEDEKLEDVDSFPPMYVSGN